MNRDQKAALVERISSEIEGSDAIFALDYRGISVKQAAALRTALLDADASFRVVKNTLTERAADKAGAESLKALLEGPTALTFVHGDVALAAKALATFRRREGLLEIKGGQMEGETLSIEQIEEIARLPARDVLQGQFVGVVASPITGLVRGLASLVSGLAVALRQVEQQGLVGEAAAAETETAEAAAAETQTAETAAEAAAAKTETAETETAEPEAATAEAEMAESKTAKTETAEADTAEADSAEPEAPAAESAAADVESDAPAAEAAAPTDPEPAAEAPAEPPSEAPGDPVAESETVEQKDDGTPSEGGAESQEG